MRCFSVAILAQGFKVSHDMKRSPDSFVYCIHCKEHVDSPDPGFNSHMMCRVFLAAGLKDGRKYRTLVYNLQNGILKRPDVQKCFYYVSNPKTKPKVRITTS